MSLYLNARQLNVLEWVDGGATAGMVAEALRLEVTAVRRTLVQLHKHGLVARERHGLRYVWFQTAAGSRRLDRGCQE